VRGQSSRTVVNQLVWVLPEADTDGAEDFVSRYIPVRLPSRTEIKQTQNRDGLNQ